MIEWNYRVFREDDGDYTIREVFYDDDRCIAGCTENPVEPVGRSLEELAKQIEWFKEALGLPVLTLKDIPELASSDVAKAKHDRSRNISHQDLRAELGLE